MLDAMQKSFVIDYVPVQKVMDDLYHNHKDHPLHHLQSHRTHRNLQDQKLK